MFGCSVFIHVYGLIYTNMCSCEIMYVLIDDVSGKCLFQITNSSQMIKIIYMVLR